MPGSGSPSASSDQGNGVGSSRNLFDPHLTGAVVVITLVIVADDDRFWFAADQLDARGYRLTRCVGEANLDRSRGLLFLLLRRGAVTEDDLGFFPGDDLDLLPCGLRRLGIRRWGGFHDRDRTGRDALHGYLTVPILVAEWPECLASRRNLDGVAGHR